MAGVEEVQPNAKSNELEDQRKESLNSFIKERRFGKKKSEGEETSSQEKSEENQEKSKEKLDKEEKNSYINNEDSQEGEEPTEENEQADEESSDAEESAEEKYEKILNETFGGDPKKAVKSWQEASKNYTKLRKEAKGYEEKLEYLDELVQKNPMLEEVIMTAAEKGNITKEDLQNFLKEGSKEPQGKPDNVSDKSKLEIVDDDFDVSDIDTKTLVESGYLNRSDKESLSPTEWSIAKRQAAIRYAEDNLPKKIANKALQEFQSQIDKKQKQAEQEKIRERNEQLNAERYEKGVDRVIDEFGLDFAGNEEHEEMLEEIESLAANIRDPRNNNVIHPNAIYLAAVEVMEERGIEPESTDVDEKVQKAKQDADESFDKRTGFNANTKQLSDEEPETWADKMAKKHVEQYKKEQDKRRKTGRIKGDSSS